MSSRRISRVVGDVISIPLPDGKYAYGRVLEEPLVAFYELESEVLLDVQQVVSSAVAFKIDVFNYAIEKGVWSVIGHLPLENALREEPLFYKLDPITKQIYIYKDSTGEEWPATAEDCRDLECAAVWEPSHVVERLVDHFAGRPNRWVESMRLH